jgi:hypothetical protein
MHQITNNRLIERTEALRYRAPNEVDDLIKEFVDIDLDDFLRTVLIAAIAHTRRTDYWARLDELTTT